MVPEFARGKSPRGAGCILSLEKITAGSAEQQVLNCRAAGNFTTRSLSLTAFQKPTVSDDPSGLVSYTGDRLQRSPDPTERSILGSV
jgi:hypothetical protein